MMAPVMNLSSRTRMQNLLISFICIASLALTGCSWWNRDTGETIEYQSSVLESLPLVYKPDIQQGNVVTQEMVNQLQPGMSRRQVRFVMGTPMLTDVFHENRWDYVYSMRKGHEDPTTRRLALYFEGDNLARIEGDPQPQPNASANVEPKERVVSVPDHDGADQGIFSRVWSGTKQTWEGLHTPEPSIPAPGDRDAPSAPANP